MRKRNKKPARPRRLSTGIRRRRFSIEACVHVHGAPRYKSFPPHTPLSEIQAWRREQTGITRRARPRRRRLIDISTECEELSYIYFIANSQDQIKIGIAIDPIARLRSLQTSSASPLAIVAAAPAFAEVERQLHLEFSVGRLSGEWFVRTPELDALIQGIAAGEIDLNARFVAMMRSVPATVPA